VEYGLRKIGNSLFIGNSDVTVETNSDPYITHKHFRGTLGLWKLLNRKNLDKHPVSEDDLKQYRNILDLTNAHLEGYEPGAPSNISNLPKFKIIAKRFLHTRRRGLEAALRKNWKKI
jgi:hypothetical protein